MHTDEALMSFHIHIEVRREEEGQCLKAFPAQGLQKGPWLPNQWQHCCCCSLEMQLWRLVQVKHWPADMAAVMSEPAAASKAAEKGSVR